MSQKEVKKKKLTAEVCLTHGALGHNWCLTLASWLVQVKTFGFQSFLDFGTADKGMCTCISVTL